MKSYYFIVKRNLNIILLILILIFFNVHHISSYKYSHSSLVWAIMWMIWYMFPFSHLTIFLYYIKLYLNSLIMCIRKQLYKFINKCICRSNLFKNILLILFKFINISFSILTYFQIIIESIISFIICLYVYKSFLNIYKSFLNI